MDQAFKIFIKNNFLAFCKYYLPHWFPLPFCHIHKDWAKLIERARWEPIIKGEKAPRELAKTTIFCQAAPLYWIAHDRQTKWQVVQQTGDSAACVRAVMLELDGNEKLINDFGRFKPSNPRIKWSYEEGGIVEGAIDRKNLTVAGSGVRGAKIGSRTTKLSIDDIHDLENVSSQYQRDKTIEWVMSAVMPTLVAKGSAFFTNSSYHEDDLLNRYEKKKIKFSYKDDLGNIIIRDFKIDSYDWIKQDKYGNDIEETIWLERRSYNELMSRKAIMANDSWFNMQYRNQIQSEETAAFKMAHLEKLTNKNISYVPFLKDKQEFGVVIQAWDLAATEDKARATEKDSDFYVCKTFGIRRNGKRVLLNLFEDRGLDAPAVLKKVMELYYAFTPDVVVVESNQFQRWFADYLLKVKHLPIDKSVTVHQDKVGLKLKSSVLHMAVENCLWELPYKTDQDKAITDRIIRQFYYFGKDVHDDIVMAGFIFEKFLGNAQQIAVKMMEENQVPSFQDVPRSVDL
jgi:phage terminase large subunit-like protein